MICRVLKLGQVNYDRACQIQLDTSRKILCGEIPDTLLLLEHPPTITVGKTGKLENILVSKDELENNGVSLFFTDRGGDVTFHCPGQLVIYPIIDLRQRGRNVHTYVYDLEEVIIRTLGHFGIQATRESHAGVWLQSRQIAAIGISIKRWITMHGIALNVCPNLDDFRVINPCGMAGVPVTSIKEVTGQEVSVQEVEDIVIGEYATIFNTVMEETRKTETNG
jgi:lipoate-protein ligase B